MSKERLEAVKYAWHIDGDISDYHFYWLIERVQELQAENETLSSANQDLLHEVRVLKNKAERAQELEEKFEERENELIRILTNRYKYITQLENTEIILSGKIKRYRDVIEIAIHNMKGCSDLGTVFALNELERVLEDAE